MSHIRRAWHVRGCQNYKRGSNRTEQLRTMLDTNAEILTHVVTPAELTSKFRREGLDVEVAWQAIRTMSRVFTPDATDAKNAGILHATIKEKSPNFSLADAFVLQAARKLNCRVLSCDPDFRGIRDAVMLNRMK